MDNLHSTNTGTKFIQFLGIILRFLGFYIVGPSIALIAFSIVLGIGIQDVSGLYFDSDNSTSHKVLLLSIQGVGQIIGFIILPLLYVHFFNRSLFSKLRMRFDSPQFSIYFILAILVILSSIPFISWVINLNKSMNLPDFLSGVERTMQASEKKLEYITQKLAIYTNTAELIATLIVFAIIPAIGEEVLFRGVIQNEMDAVFKNHHLAIWGTGLLFSFMHFQFYGFFPRLFLGVTFGYLYFWSGNIIIPILVHFLNNALTLLSTNLYKQKVISVDPDSPEFTPFYGVIISAIVFTALLLTFKNLRNKTP